jgi:hemoglobin
MGETGVPDALRARLRESFMGTADWMRNKGV